MDSGFFVTLFTIYACIAFIYNNLPLVYFSPEAGRIFLVTTKRIS